ncbi:MAG: restriction endonuclease [Acidobacteria bacterium]|nr:restriction endonuclease [Acidobacteriota bacterium]
MTQLPYEILEAMIQCFGRCFHYKDRMAAFLNNCEVPRPLTDKYRQEFKFTWARKLLTELGDTENGRLLQRKILTALCQLRNLPDDKVPDRDASLNALRTLKELAIRHDLVAHEEMDKSTGKKRLAEEQSRIVRERAAKLEALRKSFNAAVMSSNRQGAGYSLEDLLRDLFALFEIEYRKPFRTETQQIDGHFNFLGFDYLVEAKWRQDQPTEQELGAFKHKVDGKLESTRGIFISIPGFRPEVVAQFNGSGPNLILMDGQDLIHILEGRIDLRDGLKKKVEKAAQEGIVFAALYQP